MKLRYLANSKPRIPLIPVIVWWLFFDRIGAPIWVRAVVFTLCGIETFLVFVMLLHGEAVSVLEGK